VQSHNDQAEFGQVLGGIVNVVIKSGTNAYHGTLWEFVRNEQFDGRSFFSATREPLRQNQFGVAGGGPIWIPRLYKGTNRTFFHGGYEGYRQHQASSTPLLVPTQKELGATSAVMGRRSITRLRRARFQQSGQFSSDSLLRKRHPESYAEPCIVGVGQAIGTSTLAGYNLTNTTRERTDQDSYQMRVDQVFNNRNVLFASVSGYTQTQIGSLGQPWVSAGGLPGALNESDLTGWNWALQETHTVGPSAVLDVQARLINTMDN
jgi:hypothetical protein